MKGYFKRHGVFWTFVLSFALCALGASTGASAANFTAGGIYGEAQPGTTVIATSNGTGLTRETTTNSAGHFEFVQLPIGVYTVRVQQNGNVVETAMVRVTINHSTHARFAGEAQALGTIQVTGGAINPIDVTKTNTSLVLNSAQFDQLPIARNENAITLLAPSVIQSSPRLGVETTSFGGASSAENLYLLNGLNVTNNRNFVAFSHPPFEGLEEYQVITGGLPAEYGGAIGGVLNIVTKSGTNTYHAGANIFYSPSGLRSETPVVSIPNYQTGGSQVSLRHPISLVNPESRTALYEDVNNLVYNVYGSGPIVKDHLFFYALYQGNNFHGRGYSLSERGDVDSGDPQYLAKVDYQINDANLLELTAYSSKHGNDYTFYSLQKGNGASRAIVGDARTYTNNAGGKAYIGKYTLVPTNDFNISAMFGYVTFDESQESNTRDCPQVSDDRSGTAIHLGCWSAASYQGEDDYAARHETRIDAEWQLGPHDITFGYDKQAFYAHISTVTTGGVGWIYYSRPSSGTTQQGSFAIPAGVDEYVERRFFSNAAIYHNYRHAYYAQDNWKIGNFYFRFGGRLWSNESNNGSGITFLSWENQFEPRLGLSWDVFGNSSLKLYANAGRYAIRASGDLNERLAGGETDCFTYYTFTGMDPATGAPTGLKRFAPAATSPETTNLGFCVNGANGTPDNPSSLLAKNIEPPEQQEIILGAQYRIEGTQWSVGLRGIRRKLLNYIDDVCGANPPAFFMLPVDEGGFNYDNHIYNYVKEHAGKATADQLPGCFLMNPGHDAVSVNQQTGETFTIPAKVFRMPEPERYYNAIELKFDRAFDGKWFMHASIVWSHLYGNEMGYTLPSIGQVDAGITELFDFPGLMEGGYGNLDNDTRWQVKVFGAYNFAPEWRVGFNVHYRSGLSLSCRGIYAGSSPSIIARAYGSVSHFCNGKLTPQGSLEKGPRVYWLDLSLNYLPDWAPGLKFGVAVNNVFDYHQPTALDLTYSSGGLFARDASYLTPTYFQDPRSVRFSIEYDFL